jgi:uncharacterized zinc-type alcohol dehydrogenase-like protein
MSDCLTGRGKWGDKIRPLCPGHEVVAEVIAKGNKVSNFNKGDTIAFGPFRDSCGKCDFCKEGRSNACLDISYNEKKLYALYFGGYSTHIQQPTSHAYKIPSGLDLKKVPPLLCAGVTVFTPLLDYCKPNMKVGVIGVGGLGHLAVQFAKAMKAEVFGLTTSPHKKEFIQSLGATDIVLWKKKNFHLDHLNSFDLLINTISGSFTTEEFSAFSKIMRPYGKFIQVGIPENDQKFDVNYKDIVGKQISIIGSNVGGRFHTEKMLDFAAEHNIECICEFYDWEEFPKALNRLENERPIFRCVVDVESNNEFNS